MCIFFTVGDLKKVGGSGEKGGKMCGCKEKDYKHTLLLEKSNYLSVTHPLARKIKLPISHFLQAYFINEIKLRSFGCHPNI